MRSRRSSSALEMRRRMASRVDRRQLSALLAVGEELHFGRAAERLALQQSALSQLVRRMEDQLGFLLFDRSSHHVRLTVEGERMLVVGRDALEAMGQVDEVAADIAAGSAGTLRLGTTQGVREQLHATLERFRERHPDVEVRLSAMHTAEKVRALLDGELDAAFVRAADKIDGLDLLQLWSEPLVAMLSHRHPLAGCDRLSIRELSAYPVIMNPPDRNPWARDQTERMFAAAGAAPLVGPAYMTLREAVALIASSQAWMLVRGSVAEQERSALLVSRPFVDPSAVGRVSLAWRTVDSGPVARLLVGVVSALRREGAFEPRPGVRLG
jgi:DNA-binding transcriptional LysR family regulator